MTLIATAAGNLGKDAEFKEVNGNPLCQFSVATSSGYGDKRVTTWVDVSRWGKGADKLASMLTKGSKVTVVGELTSREHNGKTYLQIRADHVALQGGGQSAGTDTAREYGYSRPQGAQGGRDLPADDLDDDIPFATSSFAHEHRVS